ncbi:glycosyltransferase family 2 protein [Candidatus Marinimicrobia bacterium]|nr:glycosyltransferase family 2 protein [Candidatus Neomarinimicrobiota bacterium]MDC0383427.1 glycosyltransferase family 2 protein [Candidatus Neomarinimicrobiota bacterium]
MPYSIIIPIYNEEKTLDKLLLSLKKYSFSKNEILIINDGSIDGTEKILKKYNFINVIELKKNYGKGTAIKIGLHKSIHNKTIIYDGDLELHVDGINELMRLDRDHGIYSLMGTRFNNLSPFKSKFEWGNFMFTSFFNLLFKSFHKDILCCAKAFYKEDLPIKKIDSKGFDIDIELSSFLTKNNRNKIIQVNLKYNRRSIEDGKKLKISDGWIILKRILFTL